MSRLFDFAVLTIFARETLEGGIIIGEYRTIILRGDWQVTDLSQRDALRTVTTTAIAAASVALLVCAALAIPLAVLSRDFNAKTAILVEGISKIVAAVCLLQLSLKMPTFFGLYRKRSSKAKNGIEQANRAGEAELAHGLTIRSMRFNIAWNIWREVAECGVFLIPFFLKGDDIKAVPLSAIAGIAAGGIICLGIYHANQRLKSTIGLAIFTSSLLLLLSTGLFSDGCHKFEVVYGFTPIVWQLEGDFWSVNRLPMTIFKPFGYNNVRTLLQLLCFWLWLFFGCALHYRKFLACYEAKDEVETANESTDDDVEVVCRQRGCCEDALTQEQVEMQLP